MVFLTSGDLKKRFYNGPGLRSDNDHSGNSFFHIVKFTKKLH